MNSYKKHFNTNSYWTITDDFIKLFALYLREIYAASLTKDDFQSKHKELFKLNDPEFQVGYFAEQIKYVSEKSLILHCNKKINTDSNDFDKLRGISNDEMFRNIFSKPNKFKFENEFRIAVAPFYGSKHPLQLEMVDKPKIVNINKNYKLVNILKFINNIHYFDKIYPYI
ncbi:MAG: hypothetical protein R1F52_04445 [Candidatus Nitrosoabyssus spongiisocia]|nr:MAG: hypothetical protein R1F52_04445 [Nitrosopumilaceae archaeon AB1(1)]